MNRIALLMGPSFLLALSACGIREPLTVDAKRNAGCARRQPPKCSSVPSSRAKLGYDVHEASDGEAEKS